MFFQLVEIAVGYLWLQLPLVEQPQVIEHIIHVLKVRILISQPAQLFFTQMQVIEFILEDDTTMIEGILDDHVTFFHLLFGERNLRQVIFPFMWIVLYTVCCLR